MHFILFYSCLLEDFLKSKLCGDNANIPVLKFEQLPFNHPLFILYSSGTTGAPKCIVHSAGVRMFFINSSTYCLKIKLTKNDLGGCPRGVMFKAMDCEIVVSEFELQSCY